jgi:DNA relaxase NicK
VNRTHVDWLGLRTKGTMWQALQALRPCFGGRGRELKAEARGHGALGYRHAADVLLDGMRVGLVLEGGESQRGWISVNINGTGCGWVDDWDRAQDVLGGLPGMELRRVDLALDTRDGSVGHETVMAGYQAGMFKTHGAGRPPSIKQILPGDPREGRTVYIGSRAQGKFFRGYEKGYELAKHFPLGVVTHIDDVPIADLYRCEVELKAKEGPLPADLIDRADQYFAGSYPYLAHVLTDVDPEIFVQRRERGPQLELAGALSQIRRQWGSTLFTAMVAHQGDVTAVWDRIVGREHNASLVAAGVLMLEHE